MQQNKIILIVDDEEIVRESLALWLESKGWKTAQAASADAALALDRAFDAYIVDLYMPVKDGIAFSKELKAKVENPNVILMSGYVTEEMRKEAVALGIDAILRKPFKFEEIDTILKSLLVSHGDK